jgi:hypothetical protein
MQQLNWNGEKALHPTIDVHANESKLFAAVRPTDFTGAALTAAHVRFNCTLVAGPQATSIFGHLHDLAG